MMMIQVTMLWWSPDAADDSEHMELHTTPCPNTCQMVWVIVHLNNHSALCLVNARCVV